MRHNQRAARISGSIRLDAFETCPAFWVRNVPLHHCGSRVRFGVGIHTGPVVLGAIGIPQRSDFTAIGDGVNLAARLESENKVFKTHIIISESTLEELGEAAQVNPLGSVVVKGKTVGVQIYELKALVEAPVPVVSNAHSGD